MFVTRTIGSKQRGKLGTGMKRGAAEGAGCNGSFESEFSHHRPAGRPDNSEWLAVWDNEMRGV